MIPPPARPLQREIRADAVRLACHAMASRFELVLFGEEPVRLRAAGEAALAEIQRIGEKLTRFRAMSDIGRINAAAAGEPVRVEAPVFELLRTCRQLCAVTGGAFDVTVAPLMQAWGFSRSSGRIPDAAELEVLMQRTGMHLVELDEQHRTVHFARPGVEIDLGAIGKGYAVDEAVLLLREYGVERAFLHGGTSTMAAIGTPPDADAWHVAIPHPETQGSPEPDILRTVALVDETLSVSAVWGRAFEVHGTSYGHVLDPRVGKPVTGALLAAVQHESATIADALSTALLVGPEDVEFNRHVPGLRALVVRHGVRGQADGAEAPEPLRQGVEVW